MKPTVGCAVLYHPIPGVIHTALIAYVHSDTMVNLAAFDCDGNPYGHTSVQLLAPDAPNKPEFGSYCEWPAVVAAKPVEQITITLSKALGESLERLLLRAEKEMLEQS